MRRVVLACIVIALLAGCQQPADAPAGPAAEPASAPTPVMPADAPPQEEVDPTAAAAATPASAVTCRDELGEVAAVKLVERCVAVSPASHPPCNPDNPCRMIQDEIDRACALWTREGNAPPECAA